MSPIDPLRSVLDGADHVYVAIRTSRGPHVTPELFTVSGGRLVCLTGASTLKAKRTRRDPIVGLAGRSSAGVFSAVAQVEVLDPADPRTSLKAPLAAATSPLDLARFVRDNAAELRGAAVDAVFGRLGIPPEHRVALVLTVTASAGEADGRTWSDGWPGLSPVPGEDAADGAGSADTAAAGDIDLDGVPADLRDLVEPTAVVLGWMRADGSPLALPARWERGPTVAVSRSLFEATGAAPASPAGVTFDSWTGLGPTGKHGLMLRGTGRATSEGAVTRIGLELDRATYWDGIQTGTVRVDKSS